jgi:aspartyl-tRNA(Asn)/glutamyl-tRNA(Gln) amidotransferase subunit A
MTDLMSLTLCELSDGLAKKQFSPTELMRATLDRIEAVDRGKINAVVALADPDRLMAQAREADARVARGEARPLEGIPLGVKDFEDAAGFVTSCGSPIFKDNVATQDSIQVARLRAAGAIVVSKTNIPVFASTVWTKNRVYGVTRNPWNPEFSCGGSSGGSAAAIAGSILPLVTGSDGGGSVRGPSALCGTFGLKPSNNRIPIGPNDRWDWPQLGVYGPITKTVEDAALFLDQTVGASEWDEHSLPHPGYSYLTRTRAPIDRKLRIAYAPDFGYAVVQSEVATKVAEAAQAFARLGHTVETISDGPPNMQRGWVLLESYNAYCHYRELIATRRDDFERGNLASLEAVKNTTAEELEKAVRRRARVRAYFAELFAKYDVLLTPTFPYDGHPARGPYLEEIEGKDARKSGPGCFTIPFNMTRHPAANVRVGLSNRGLPIGMQIVGPQHRDDLVLQVARAFERERPWHPHWPLL